MSIGLALSGAAVSRAVELFRRRGYVVLGPPALDASHFAALRDESVVQRRKASWDLDSERRDIVVEQRTVRAHLGPLARQLMAAQSTLHTLQTITGSAVTPGWSATCLTYYEQNGQYLGEHTDKPDACRYAMLVYLEARATTGPRDTGTALHIRRSAGDGGTDVVLAVPNRVLLLAGSQLAHGRPAMRAGETVGLLAGCYALA